MSQEKLRDASDVLRNASESADGETASRLREQADALADLAERERGPDHGRVARHQQKLKDIKAADESVAEAVDEANERLNEYRETVEGV